MTAILERAAEVPANVPADLVCDFDMYHLPEVDAGETCDVHLAWKRVQDENPDLFWTPFYGGHWVVTRAEDIKWIQQDHALFSNRESFIPRGVIPFQLPVQLDPPEHTPYRRIFMPAFLHKALAEIDQKARAVAVEIIERLKPQGRCEFVRDFAGTMPIVAFLSMMGLPDEDYRKLRDMAYYMSKPAHPESPGAWAMISDYVRGWIEERQRHPGPDLISTVVQAKVNDRPLTEDEVFSLCLLLLGGGLDTVVSMTSFIACYLAQNPAHRRELVEHPELTDRAIEEFVRRFGTSNLAREVRQDVEVHGQSLKTGDIVMIPLPLAGIDERANPDPLTVDFRRRAKHVTFGNGPHTCPGAVLARREIRIFLEEWLARIPDFRLDGLPKFTTGLVNSVSELRLVWPTDD